MSRDGSTRSTSRSAGTGGRAGAGKRRWRKLSAFRRLPGPRRRLLVGAALRLLLVDLGLRLLGFARVRRLLARPAAPAPAPGTARERREEAEALAWAVAAAARHHLYPMRCLPRALVLWRFLSRRGIPGELQIGVRTEAGELRAHAWVELDGRPLGEGADVGDLYASLTLPAP